MRLVLRLLRLLLLVWLAAVLGSCEEPRVYGSIGVSSYSGYGGMRYGMSVGGRIL